MSKSFTHELRERFSSIVCVEILDVPAFCSRVKAALPPVAKFPEHKKKRHAQIGHLVEYYPETEGGNPRWALPERIATSKLDNYAWQNEFRLVFTLTDAFAFENVTTSLVHRLHPKEPRKPDEHRHRLVEAQSLRDICLVHDFSKTANFP